MSVSMKAFMITIDRECRSPGCKQVELRRRYEKVLLAEAQNALGKQEYVLWNAGVCPIRHHHRNSLY